MKLNIRRRITLLMVLFVLASLLLASLLPGAARPVEGVIVASSHIQSAQVPGVGASGPSSEAPMSQIDIPGPAGSGTFGYALVLPNGNFVVVDTGFDEGGMNDIGAVYLYDGATLAIISTLKGGTSSDRVGYDGITILPNGNYVVESSYWDNTSPAAVDAGAVTWCSATIGCNGTVSASNSLVGGTANDHVGDRGIYVLTNGNYVVGNYEWDNPVGPTTDAGAVTWGNGMGGTVGLVTSSNSLIGGTANDYFGLSVTPLSNGNYVVSNHNWDNPVGPVTDVGAVTWGNGMGGTVGLVTPSNSLVGGTAGDQVGTDGFIRTIALTNGNYVVSSPNWNNPVGLVTDAGAVTWGNGMGGTVGLVTPSNSLVGGTANDHVGDFGATALTNGNYVVSSSDWNNPVGTVLDAGAVTWGNGTGGTVGLITSSNSLVGGTNSDHVGNSDVIVLTNSNYVVLSYEWDNPMGPVTDAGAATWGNDTGGTVGLITLSNSLVGGRYNDYGSATVTALTNGNYVVSSSDWDNPVGPVTDVGAVTWGNGLGGTVGPVTSSNSLVGGTESDSISNIGITALTNGNYVVHSRSWDNPVGPATDAGAATWGNGTGGTVGLVTSSNSLVGGTDNDYVGLSVLPLTNGNYVVLSYEWDNPMGPVMDAGAATWCNGTGGTVGLVTSSNSLVGGTNSDYVGGGGFRALTNGNYVVHSRSWDNPSLVIVDAGAVTWANGTGGTVGLITSADSVLGTVTDGVSGFSFDYTRNRLFVWRPASNIVSILYFGTTSTPTSTPTYTPTRTPTPLTQTYTPTTTRTNIPTNTPTYTPTRTPTPLAQTPTSTQTNLPTNTPTYTPTRTPTTTRTTTQTNTVTRTSTATLTPTTTRTNTSTATSTRTSTSTSTRTNTPTSTATSTITATPTATPTKLPCSDPAFLQAGINDNFALPTETALPTLAQKTFAQQQGQWPTRSFDQATANGIFMHSFTSLLTDHPICNATLTLHLKALILADDDTLNLGTAPGPERWSANIGSLNTPPCTWGSPGCTEVTLSLNLSTLPLSDGSGTVLDYLNRHGELPVYIQDDTMVDYMTLDVCHCGPPVTCVPEPPNMTHWYPFDATSITMNSAAIDIVGGRNGQHRGQSGQLPVPLLGQKVANSVTLGTNRWIAVVWYWSPSYTVNDDFSIDAWVKTSQTLGTQVLVDKRSTTPVGYELEIYNGYLRFRLNNKIYWDSTISNPVITDGNWHMVGVSVKRSGAAVSVKGMLYVDAVPVYTFAPLTSSISSSVPLWIGRNHPVAGPSTPDQWLNGSLDELEFFNRALTAQDMFNIYKAQSAGKCKDIHTP